MLTLIGPRLLRPQLAKGTTSRYVQLVGQGGKGWKRALTTFQEFGTVPGPLVLRGMVMEHAEFLHRGKGAAAAQCGGGSAVGSKTVRDVFYVQSVTWQRKVVQRGVKVVEQAVRALADAPESVPLCS